MGIQPLKRVFVSYNHSDGQQVTDAVEGILLELTAVVDRDCRFLELGCEFTTEIVRRIRATDIFVVILTKEAAKSPWICAEVGIAFDLGKRIVPLLVDGFITPDFLLPYLYGRHSHNIRQPITNEERETLRSKFVRLLQASSDNNAEMLPDLANTAQQQTNWITNNQYLEFWLEHGRSVNLRPPRHWSHHTPYFSQDIASLAVADVSWEDAQVFCDWAGCRLLLQDEIVKGLLINSFAKCPDIWIDGGTHDEKMIVLSETGRQVKVKGRDFRSPTLGFATAPLSKIHESEPIWMEGCNALSSIDMPMLRILADRHKIPNAWFAPIAHYAAASDSITDFRIGRDCVTNTQYWQFAKTGAIPYPRHWSHNWISKWKQPFPPRIANCPVVNVHFEHAQAYARWKKASLPNLIQRRYAVQFGHGGLYAWGTDFIATRCNSLESDRGELACVDEFALGASSLGIRQLCGNNWEWVIAPDGKAVLCGGSYRDRCEYWSAACVYCDPILAPIETDLIGFRIVFQ